MGDVDENALLGTFDIKTEETLRAELIGKMDLRAL
jgi:hypothetical protein